MNQPPPSQAPNPQAAGAPPPSLAVNLAPGNKEGLWLANPVLVASGTFGYGTEYQSLVDIQRIGAICSKGITVRPRDGNRMPRIAETPAGMLNAIGLQNVGLRALVEDKAPIWERWQVPVIVNISGESVAEFEELASTLDGVPGVAGLEVNISCPNIRAGGRLFADDAESAATVTRACRAATSLPMMVKLSPNVGNLVEIGKAVEAAGADCLSVANTFLGMVVDVSTRCPYLANTTGGLSGPAIRPIVVRMVYQLASAVSVPIVGVGGVTSVGDALQYLMAGATAVQVGTANFVNPRTALEIADGLATYLATHGLSDVREIVGVAQLTRHQTMPTTVS
ncbi:MAG: dihydroorotate dehydrogenase [Chloroflexi bacterium]|nr:dihydroorotate dehydrogenase [Chloroflexota bacterium]